MPPVSITVPCCACAVGSWLAEELDAAAAGADVEGMAAACADGQRLGVQRALPRWRCTPRRAGQQAVRGEGVTAG